MSLPLSQPDILLVLVDDMGYSDIGCFGGEIDTPTLDRLGRQGVRFSHFYNSPRCSPSRASLLTGLHPHQVGVGILNFDDSPDGYPGNLSENCVTIAECLHEAGYATHLSGKWHLASDMETPNPAWPTRRGFEHFYGTLEGAGNFFNPRTLHRGEQEAADEAAAPGFYYTDAISQQACHFVDEHLSERAEQPFFCYLAYTAPHWPLHAHEDDIAGYQGRFDAGWDQLRTERLERLVTEGLLQEKWPLTERDRRVPAWEDAPHHQWESRRMEVYAAQVTAMDRGLGEVIERLAHAGRLDNTIVVFLSDNGGCAEELDRDFVEAFVPLAGRTKDGRDVVAGNEPSVMPGDESTYASYGRAWANLSNTPFREYKHWVHEGGISTPLLVHWPAGIKQPGRVEHQPFQLVDLLPSLLEAAGANYPDERDGRPVPRPEGQSFLPTIQDAQPSTARPLFWEHEGNAGVREGQWKLVRKWGQQWELYDMNVDRTELNDLSADHPGRADEMAVAYDAWARRCGVIPRQVVLDLYKRRGNGLPPE